MKRIATSCLLLGLFIVLVGCVGKTTAHQNLIFYRQEMRSFVQKIAVYSRRIDPEFIVVAQNGEELVVVKEGAEEKLARDYVDNISGISKENLFYGYYGVDTETPVQIRERMLSYLQQAKDNKVTILTVDYCRPRRSMENAYQRSAKRGFIPFAAPRRELDVIPEYPDAPYQVDKKDITSLAKANNFLYLINPRQFVTKEELLTTLATTNYDLLVIDLFFTEQVLTADDIQALKTKANGGERLVIAYLSIGEAEEYRYYWQESWEQKPPSWLEAENKNWLGNYKVKYWQEDWQQIIYGSQDAYLNLILKAEFDGVYLDRIDSFLYFEAKKK